jgi:hypothetical protein
VEKVSFARLKQLDWDVVVRAPEILYLGIVISASGLKDISDIRDRSEAQSFHKGLFWMLMLLVLMSTAVYGDLRGTALRSPNAGYENPNLLLPVVLTGVMTALSAVAHKSLLRIERRNSVS